MKRNQAREIAVLLGFSVIATGEDPQKTVDDFFRPEHYATLAAEDELFAGTPSKKTAEYIRRSVVGVAEHAQELDDYITKYAAGWRAERISRSAAAVLRQAMFEILYMPDIPAAVSINEAVEIAKNYEDDNLVVFINGILGSFVRDLKQSEAAETAGEESAETPAEE